MRIISGSARGRKLATFTGQDIRPTPDRVREAIFSMVASRTGGLETLQVLDLYAGSGAMGLESLSRGAASALFIDQGSQASRLIQKNMEACNLQERGLLVRRDVLKALPELSRRQHKFDLVFLDPPYARDLIEPTLKGLVDGDLLCENALIVAESDREDSVPEAVPGLEKAGSRTYGRTLIEFYIPGVEHE